jgi:hypothetical protein
MMDNMESNDPVAIKATLDLCDRHITDIGTILYGMARNIDAVRGDRNIVQRVDKLVEELGEAHRTLVLARRATDPVGKYEVTIENKVFGYDYPPRKVIVEADGPINAIAEASKLDMFATIVGEPKFIGA